MLKECSETHSCMLGVTAVDPVPVVVFPRVANVEAAHSVWCPCLSITWCDMYFNFASEWCEGVWIVIMFTPEVRIC